MERTHRTYLSYLLRLWREERGEKIVWRASLESVQTGEKRSFGTIDDLFRFLREQTETSAIRRVRGS